jgi:hypothetical protein
MSRGREMEESGGNTWKMERRTNTGWLQHSRYDCDRHASHSRPPTQTDRHTHTQHTHTHTYTHTHLHTHTPGPKREKEGREPWQMQRVISETIAGRDPHRLSICTWRATMSRRCFSSLPVPRSASLFGAGSIGLDWVWAQPSRAGTKAPVNWLLLRIDESDGVVYGTCRASVRIE